MNKEQEYINMIQKETKDYIIYVILAFLKTKNIMKNTSMERG